MKIYEAPAAKTVAFEAVNIITTSATPDVLNTWGENIRDIDSEEANLFG